MVDSQSRTINLRQINRHDLSHKNKSAVCIIVVTRGSSLLENKHKRMVRCDALSRNLGPNFLRKSRYCVNCSNFLLWLWTKSTDPFLTILLAIYLNVTLSLQSQCEGEAAAGGVSLWHELYETSV